MSVLVITRNWEKLNGPICPKITALLICLELLLFKDWNWDAYIPFKIIKTEHHNITTLCLINRNFFFIKLQTPLFQWAQRTNLLRQWHEHHFSHPSFSFTPPSQPPHKTPVFYSIISLGALSEQSPWMANVQNRSSFICMLGRSKFCYPRYTMLDILSH